MERFIANLVKDFESGKISRRQFCETVALAATMQWGGEDDRHQQLTGADVTVRVVSPRRQMQGALGVRVHAAGFAPAFDGAVVEDGARWAVGE